MWIRAWDARFKATQNINGYTKTIISKLYSSFLHYYQHFGSKGANFFNNERNKIIEMANDSVKYLGGKTLMWNFSLPSGKLRFCLSVKKGYEI